MTFVVDVFLSSTFEDLRAYSDAVYDRLNGHEMFRCIHQRDFGARDASAVEYCRSRVLKAELYVGIIGMRRGWEPKADSNKRSITEMEHDWAKGLQKPRFLYVSPPGFPVPGDKPEPIAMHKRQLAFRKRLMEQGERVVSQSGFKSPDLLAAEIQSALISHVATSELIKKFRSDLAVLSPASPEEQRPAISGAVERLAKDRDVDLLTLAKNPKDVDLTILESKLKARAVEHESQGRSALKTSAEYWRHIGALAFLHNPREALKAYEKAVALDPSEPEGWQYLGELQFLLGKLEDAAQSFDRVLALGRSADNLGTMALGHIRLAWVFSARGDLTRAEEQIADAIRFAERANWHDGLARAFGNLGIIHLTRGELDKAEEMQRRSLSRYVELDNKDGMARAFGNLGNIFGIRGDLDKAEEMHRESLALNEKAGRKDGMARAYANLGIIYKNRGELDKAEDMQRKALAIHEQLDNKQGLASVYSNLGNLYGLRGELDKAEDMLQKSLVLNKELVSKEGMATAYANLGALYMRREKLDQAEEMLDIALALNDELGRKVGSASALVNLGIIHKRKGDSAVMDAHWRRARDLYTEMGLRNEVAMVDELLAQGVGLLSENAISERRRPN